MSVEVREEDARCTFPNPSEAFSRQEAFSMTLPASSCYLSFSGQFCAFVYPLLLCLALHAKQAAEALLPKQVLFMHDCICNVQEQRRSQRISRRAPVGLHLEHPAISIDYRTTSLPPDPSPAKTTGQGLSMELQRQWNWKGSAFVMHL